MSGGVGFVRKIARMVGPSSVRDDRLVDRSSSFRQEFRKGSDRSNACLDKRDCMTRRSNLTVNPDPREARCGMAQSENRVYNRRALPPEHRTFVCA
jgi:hypothetical protein